MQKFSLPQDFVDFFKLLEKNNVDYLIVGSWAVALHGRPRYTKDIDILIARDATNAKKLLLALNEFGFGSLELSEDDFLKEEFVIQLGYEPNRIDILTDISGVIFKEAKQNSIEKSINGMKLKIISINDLIQAKKSAGRPQDLADIDQLQKINSLKK